jgi:cob(I)alamin adenosyltransferase
MGYVYLYYGTGGGKTANALGLALRSVGHNQKVVIVQFFKWRKDIGEYLVQEKLKPYYEIHQFAREAWLGEEEKTAEFAGEKFKVECVKSSDKELAKKGLDFAEKVLREKKPHLLVRLGWRFSGSFWMSRMCSGCSTTCPSKPPWS